MNRGQRSGIATHLRTNLLNFWSFPVRLSNEHVFKLSNLQPTIIIFAAKVRKAICSMTVDLIFFAFQRRAGLKYIENIR